MFDAQTTSDALGGDTEKPKYLKVIDGNIPEPLRTFPQWVCWRGEWDGKRWTKVPYQCNGRKADKTNPAHWSDFSEVLATYQDSDGDFDGIGFVLTDNDPFVALDLDHCIDSDGVITEQAKSVIRLMNAYTEISPSGAGIRIFVKGVIPRNRRKGPVEAYCRDWYVTVTGYSIREVRP